MQTYKVYTFIEAESSDNALDDFMSMLKRSNVLEEHNFNVELVDE